MTSEQLTNSVVPDKTYHFTLNKVLEFIPDQVGDVADKIDFDYQNNKVAYFDRVARTARPPVRMGSAPYMLVNDADSSRDTALVIALPYCNPVVPDPMYGSLVAHAMANKQTKAFDSNTWNNPIKHVYLFDVMKALDVRDAEGKTIPVLAVGADSQDYTPPMNIQQKKALRRGDLSFYARNVEDILDKEGYGNIHIGGYSQGGSIAHAVAAGAYNIDLASATLAEMPTYKNRSIGALAWNYLANKPAPKTDSSECNDEYDNNLPWTQDGPEARIELEEIQNRAFITMAKTIALRGAWRTALALRRGTMGSDLIEAVERRGVFPLTIAWNGTSSLTHDIEEKLVDEPNAEALKPFQDARLLRTVKTLGHKAVGAPHLAGESPMFYSLLFSESVKWANR